MSKMPTIYVPHGGGPWPFIKALAPGLAADYAPLRAYLESLAQGLPQRPTGLLVISAHWTAPQPTVTSSSRPPLVYDYYGFPRETYQLRWDAPGSPALAGRVRELLSDAGIACTADATRGFDHGTFVPMMLAFPEADIPTVQLSLDSQYSPAHHLAIGRALSHLRQEGVLIIGSGMSWEDFRATGVEQRSNSFDKWFCDTAVAQPQIRDSLLVNWTLAPFARVAHPREEHLFPVMVVAGAAGKDRGRIGWTGKLMGIRVSAVHFGDA